MCHGLAGYFDAKLYKDVHLSIRPSTHTPKMFSWFPIYFPIKEPFVVSQGGWRQGGWMRQGSDASDVPCGIGDRCANLPSLPVLCSTGSEIRVDMWRCDSNHKVWYEWSVSCGALRGAIHNPNGRSYAVGL